MTAGEIAAEIEVCARALREKGRRVGRYEIRELVY